MGDRVKNAVRCTICGGSADLLSCGVYECQNNKNHLGDTFVGIFTDLSYPATPESKQSTGNDYTRVPTLEELFGPGARLRTKPKGKEVQGAI